MRRLIRLAIRYGPLIYPVVRRIIEKRKQKKEFES